MRSIYPFPELDDSDIIKMVSEYMLKAFDDDGLVNRLVYHYNIGNGKIEDKDPSDIRAVITDLKHIPGGILIVATPSIQGGEFSVRLDNYLNHTTFVPKLISSEGELKITGFILVENLRIH